MNNVKKMAENLSQSTAKRALTFANDSSFDTNDQIMYNFEKGEYCEMNSPINEEHEIQKLPGVNGKMFKPIKSEVLDTPAPLKHPEMKQPIQILRNTNHNKHLPTGWTKSEPSSIPCSASSGSLEQLMKNAPIITRSTSNLAYSGIPHPSVSLPVHSHVGEGLGSNPATKPLHVSIPSQHLPFQVLANGRSPVPLPAAHQSLLKYGAKMPYMVHPGAMLQQPFIPPEGYDLVAIDAYGRMIPVQYTDMLYEMPPGYMPAFQPMVPTFRNQKWVFTFKHVSLLFYMKN